MTRAEHPVADLDPDPVATVDLEELAFDEGGYLLLKRALASVDVGARVAVCGSQSALPIHVRAWAREQGHGFDLCDGATTRDARTIACTVTRGSAQVGRWRGAVRAGRAGRDSIVENPSQSWGLAARGALVEAGAPEFHFPIDHKVEVWADEVARIYRQAAAAQWDPDRVIDWETDERLPDELEDAVVQVMTYLIENEMAALVVPSRFLARIHPHFREVLQLLAIQAADEARHIEVFTRRATLHRDELGLSTVGGQTSLQTLVDEPDFALASFLLSVLGEGSFLSLLQFLQTNAPDELTRRIMHWTAQDEARHVAFGVAHLRRHVAEDPAELGRLEAAILRRHDALQHTAGLNEEVFDALILMAAGGFGPAEIATGFARVRELTEAMHAGRRKRLVLLGFPGEQAEHLSGLHTRNFM